MTETHQDADALDKTVVQKSWNYNMSFSFLPECGAPELDGSF